MDDLMLLGLLIIKKAWNRNTQARDRCINIGVDADDECGG